MTTNTPEKASFLVEPPRPSIPNTVQQTGNIHPFMQKRTDQSDGFGRLSTALRKEPSDVKPIKCQTYIWAGTHKRRTVHNVQQVRVLEWLYSNYSQYPSRPLKRKLAEYLNMSYAQLQKWFQTRRQRTTPALLSNRMFSQKDEDTWQETLTDIRDIIKEAAVEEYADVEDCPAKKRRIEMGTILPPSSTPPLPTPASSSPEFSPVQMPSTKVLPPAISMPSPKAEPIPQPPAVNQPKEGRLPPLREFIQEAASANTSTPVVAKTPIEKRKHTPLQYPFSHFICSPDERTIILPPLPPLRRLGELS